MFEPDDELVTELFAIHGVGGPWLPLPATGVANHIFATHDVVLRIATDHVDGVSDARTESVAAPAARAAGVRTPELLVFDDSRRLVDRPYSLWERVHGETLGLWAPDARNALDTWRAVGREVAFLHSNVPEVSDPNGWLDSNDPNDPDELLMQVSAAGGLDKELTGQVQEWLRRLDVPAAVPRRFVHGDLYAMNIMCTGEGGLLAIIDWGDAGWADPCADFVQAELAAMDALLEGYESVAPAYLGDGLESRILRERMGLLLWRLSVGRDQSARLQELLGFPETASNRWRAAFR